MNRRLFLAASAAAAILPAGSAFAQQGGQKEDAKAAVVAACARAKASGRPLLLVFHASWCTYCRVFDKVLADGNAGRIMDKHLMAYHLRVQEREEKRIAMQLPGADEVFNTYAAIGVGLPYMAVLDENANKITDSIMANGDNFGFPVTAEEIQGFNTMMRKASPAITDHELDVFSQASARILRRRA